MEMTEKITERIKELMTDKEIDSTRLAKELGVSKSTVSRWINKTNSLFLSNALKIVNYFNCSLDFLVGRTEKTLDFVPQVLYPNFYQNLRAIMKRQNISRYSVNLNTKIKSSRFTSWSKGTDPRLLSLIELAEYLNVTLDNLVGREKL